MSGSSIGGSAVPFLILTPIALAAYGLWSGKTWLALLGAGAFATLYLVANAKPATPLTQP